MRMDRIAGVDAVRPAVAATGAPGAPPPAPGVAPPAPPPVAGPVELPSALPGELPPAAAPGAADARRGAPTGAMVPLWIPGPPIGLDARVGDLAARAARAAGGAALYGALRAALAASVSAGQAAAPVAARGADEEEPAAMRADQLAWMRQAIGKPAGTAALGATWRAALLAQFDRPQAGRSVPGDAVAGDGPSAVARDARLPAERVFEAPARPLAFDPWLLAAYALGGRRVLLRLLETDAEGGAARRRGGALALRLLLDLPGLGAVAVQLQRVAGGLWVDLSVEHEEALGPLRSALPAIVAALAGAGLRVLRCRLLRGVAAADRAALAGVPSGAPVAAGAAGGTPPAPDAALFRAAAEVAAALASMPGVAEAGRGDGKEIAPPI